MVFGGCSIPSMEGFGCSASICSQMVSIHQLQAISWKAMCLRMMEDCLQCPMKSMGVKGLILRVKIIALCSEMNSPVETVFTLILSETLLRIKSRVLPALCMGKCTC